MKVDADIFTTVTSEENTFILHSGGRLTTLNTCILNSTSTVINYEICYIFVV